METELLNIFDEHYNHIGTATRQDVHRLGYWHETFHCWFVSKEEEQYKLYFQIRSPKKLDLPSLLDITAAGHLLVTESYEDGVRELEEELGIAVPFNLLVPLGRISYTMLHTNKIDNEIAHTYLYPFSGHMDDFSLQLEEVAGIVKVDLVAFYRFWIEQETTNIEIEGFEFKNGIKKAIKSSAFREDFVDHDAHYYKTVLERMLTVLG